MLNERLLKQQIELEFRMHDGGIDRFNERQNRALKGGEDGVTDWDAKLMRNFIDPVSRAIDIFLEEHEGKRGTTSPVVSALQLGNTLEISYITIRAMLNAIATRDATSIQYLSKQIAGKIEDQIRFSRLGKEDKQTARYMQHIKKSLAKNNSQSYSHKKRVYSSVERKKGLDDWVKWDDKFKLYVGSTLIKLACRVVAVENDEGELEDIFKISTVKIGKGNDMKSSKIIQMSSMYASFIADFIKDNQALHPEVAPCIIPPRDWTSPFDGGFYTDDLVDANPLIKSPDRKHVRKLTKKQMPKVYKAVNHLQKTRWCVNTEVLDIMQEIVAKDIPLAIPTLIDKPKPLNPIKRLGKDYQNLKGKELKEALDNNPKTKGMWSEFVNWKQETREWHEEDRSRASNVLELVRTMKLAKQYALYDTFHYVYSVDFRCRFYVRASGLSPQGDDKQKGLLRFKVRHALGYEGVAWYKIHGANVWGENALDKEDLDTRLEVVGSKEFKDMVKRIAADPVNSREWVDADKPWQFLSWALDYADYLAWVEDGNHPQDYMTFIAPAQDGTCSGLQHYSAILLDVVGARAVNLLNSDRPQDIYKEVAKVADKRLSKAIKKAIKKRSDTLPLLNEWHRLGVSRGLCKKPVMTLPYGCTLLTCRDSMAEHIKKLQKDSDKKAKAEGRKPKPVHKFGDRKFEAERHMSDIVWVSIDDVIKAAKLGMKFIQQLAGICAKENQPFIYENYVGFIMKQEAFQTTAYTVNTVLEGRIQFKVYQDTDKLSISKMKSGSAPNTIHSQDSAHLVLVVCDCADKGITDMWVVHDDFATHACWTDKLHISLRHCFVEMYKYDVLADLKEQIEKQIGKEIDIDPPPRGELDINEVKNSRYMFS